MEKNMTEADTIVGRGNQEGSVLFRQWFQDLNNAANRGDRAAYVFVMGSLNEVLKSFGMRVTFPEITSLQLAVRHVAHEYLQEAEDYGYSPDICGYVKADIAVQLRGGDHPMGRIPKPSIAVYTNACNTYIKWAEIWERLYKIPIFTMDVPGHRQLGIHTQPGEKSFEVDRAYVEIQIRELIRSCEEVTGQKFDIDKLRQTMSYANEMSASWERVLDLNKSCPSVFNALTDGTIFLGVANAFRGTEAGAKYFANLVEEMEYKVANGIGTVANEQHRLTFVGVPCYPIFRRFNELFSTWGGTFINSTYLWFASGGTNCGYQYDLNDPIRGLAEGVLLSVRDAMDAMFDQTTMIRDSIEKFNIDGVIYHPIKSCRTVSTGLADSRRQLMKDTGLASLFIESDMMDRRVVSEAQLKNRVDAFFEGLNSRKQQVVTVAS
jgi:benzoyl-CoA reductase subunit B|tara:strand:+ start:2336 stop:3640 length:1305 start_codon:yes stop_codon:yes gene_type:complete